MSGMIPEEELNRRAHFNLAPMVDFLFIIVAVFATLAITRTALFDTEMTLVKQKVGNDPHSTLVEGSPAVVHLAVTKDGRYKWITDRKQTYIQSLEQISVQLFDQQKRGFLPQDKRETKVLLHIDREAVWEPVVQAIFAVRDAGFEVHPVYEPDESRNSL